MKRHVLVTLLPLMLAGCQAAPVAPVQDSRDVVVSAHEIQAATTRLYQAGVINQISSSYPSEIRANSDRITLRWDGDAVELLHALARQRGYRFAYTGTRLPIPVNIYVTDMTYGQVLDLIRIQTNWRASLREEGVELRLHFMLPVEKGADS